MLPFSELDNPGGVAADKHGDVFVSDGDNDRVLELPAGSSTQVVLLSGLDDPSYLALRKQTLFVGEGGAVIKFSIRSGKQKVLPFSGLSAVRGVAVDKHGDIFAADSDNNRVLELQVG
jgi:serine/threonine-protein kinase